MQRKKTVLPDGNDSRVSYDAERASVLEIFIALFEPAPGGVRDVDRAQFRLCLRDVLDDVGDEAWKAANHAHEVADGARDDLTGRLGDLLTGVVTAILGEAGDLSMRSTHDVVALVQGVVDERDAAKMLLEVADAQRASRPSAEATFDELVLRIHMARVTKYGASITKGESSVKFAANLVRDIETGKRDHSGYVKEALKVLEAQDG